MEIVIQTIRIIDYENNNTYKREIPETFSDYVKQLIIYINGNNSIRDYTVILANIVSNQPLDNVFIKEIATLVECVILGSFVYLIICYLQSHYEIQKVYYSDEQLRRNYKEILTEDDLQEIFDNDKMLNEIKKKSINQKNLFNNMDIVFGRNVNCC